MNDPNKIYTLTPSELAATIANGELRRAIIIPGSDLVERTIRTVVALGYATEAEIRAAIADEQLL